MRVRLSSIGKETSGRLITAKGNVKVLVRPINHDAIVIMPPLVEVAQFLENAVTALVVRPSDATGIGFGTLRIDTVGVSLSFPPAVLHSPRNN